LQERAADRRAETGFRSGSAREAPPTALGVLIAMRIGLLGGSFDPPHNGHLLAAGDAFDTLSLDRLVFIPTGVQPLKAGQAAATAEQRLAMVRLLVEGDARFGVDPLEIERGGLSYTVDTLTTLVARWPGAELFWLAGADVSQTFSKWREPGRIAELARIVVMQRTGVAPTDIGGALPEGTRILETRRVDISSTEIRDRVRQGKSIRGFVPEGVGEFIAREKLYK
jgi:nicotinate-nucleotide adenylyltransferase